jgi:hypothetical protein
VAQTSTLPSTICLSLLHHHVFNNRDATAECGANREKQIDHAHDGASITQNKNLRGRKRIRNLIAPLKPKKVPSQSCSSA